MTINWEPEIGDPTLVGWFTVVAYFVTAILCHRAAITANVKSIDIRTAANLEQYFWLAATITLVALGINKQLDLQSLFTEIAREIAKLQGWYGDRQRYQLMFIKGLGLVAIAIGIAMLWFLRKTAASVKLALLGFSFLGVFVITRAASFHHVDQFLGREAFGWRWNWILELSGIGTIAIACVAYLRKAKARY
ncbi:MAG: hypothetical protein V7676_10750 [Parasphingorhabdus sp.]|uniref:hypothetical protein n=1 Tax=Parasphingorhabdus sp. TaxID=2709688 RepID=UPI003002DC24